MKTFKLLISLPAVLFLVFSATREDFDDDEYAKTNTRQTTEVSYSFHPSGFVELPPYRNSNLSTVVVIAPKNCSKASARRARLLAKELEEIGIPVNRWSGISFSQIEHGQRQQLDTVMNGDIPIVFVGSKGKSNPTLREVLAEYYLLNP